MVSDKFYFWSGGNVLLETDALNHDAVTKRYFAEGVIQNGSHFYYAVDNLNSVRELVDASGIVQGSYDYDPYGVRSTLIGMENSDFGFAELFHESQSGLDLARYRGYNAAIGRWLNRDPIGVTGGINLYAYVGNNPINTSDPTGLCTWAQVWTAVTTFISNLATKDSPIPQPLSDPNDAKNCYIAAYELAKNNALGKLINSSNPGANNLINQINAIDTSNSPIGDKVIQLNQLLQNNQQILQNP